MLYSCYVTRLYCISATCESINTCTSKRERSWKVSVLMVETYLRVIQTYENVQTCLSSDYVSTKTNLGVAFVLAVI